MTELNPKEDVDNNQKDDTSNAAPTSSATIFVGNLPFDTRDDQLEKEFSEIGPIKRAFIVKDKDNRSKSRGCGYVQFVLQEDADKCVKSTKAIGNRKLRLNYAAKKPKHAKRKLLALQQAGGDAQTETPKIEHCDTESKIKTSDQKKDADNTDSKDPQLPSKPILEKENNINNKTDLQRTIVLTGLTAKVKRKAFRIMCEQFGEIENIVYPVPERDEVTAFIRFKEYKSAIRATQKIPGKKVKKSGILSACLLTKENKLPTKKKLAQARLIVRNLSFKCEEEDLQNHFAKFGKVVNVSIPTKKVNDKDVKIGCGFVQFADTVNAKAALAEMNLKNIMNRQVVVDWAIAKNMYADKKEASPKQESGDNLLNEEETEENKPKKGKKMKAEKVLIEEENEDDNDDDDNDNDDDDSDQDGDGDFESGDEDSMEEDQEGEEDEEEEDEDDYEGDDINESEDEEGEHDEANEPVIEKQKKQLKDAKEGRTIFIRNLSYNVDEGMLEEEFDKFGQIEYCKMVQDHETGRSKGTAFIKFKEKKNADVCIEEFDKKEKCGVNVVIDGRPIFVSMAVTKGKLGEIQQEKSESKKDTDKRNLYLASEGIVTRNSPAAEGLSDAELKKREKALAEKKAKLKNPNYFISRTRLCIRNLPLTTDADTLNVSLKKFVPSEVNVGKIKIMRSNDRRDLTGKPRSLGFGFIEMEEHEHALMLLRAVNNNPKVFGDQRRPIVEFSVENAKALKILELKQKRLEAKQQQLSEHGDDNEDKEKTDVGGEEKKAQQAKAYEKRKKRIARYKKKREAKKLLKVNEDSKNDSTIDSTDNIKTKESRQLAKKVTKTSNEDIPAVVDRGFKRTLPSVADDSAGQRSKKKKVVKEEEKFSSMVEQYKQKILGKGKTTAKKRNESRWFE